MAQKLIQTQGQTQTQQQKLSPSQLLMVNMLELPVTELEERVRTELDDNPALEVDPDHNETESAFADDPADSHDLDGDYGDSEDNEEVKEREERQSALDEALENIGRDDEMPDVPSATDESQGERIVYGADTSFHDELLQQAGEHELTEKQHDILEYIIGSLDDDGLLRKNASDLSDELLFSTNINASEAEIEEMVRLLQTFDPPGIGATSLQECLLLQIDRREGDERLTDLMRQVVEQCYDDFTHKRWAKISAKLHLSQATAEEVESELRRLNPKPGAAMGELSGKNIHQITPDFIVDSDDGRVTFTLNDINVPTLQVSPSFTELLTENSDGAALSKQMKEAVAYTKNKVEMAQTFIDALKQRQHTLYLTMRAIIQWQRTFFEEGDESLLRPMRLEDIATVTGLDPSTISRVGNSKYVQTKWGTFPLKFFFTDRYVNAEGEEVSTRKIRMTLKEIIDAEDPSAPFSDEMLTKKLQEAGLPVARRTVAKYREQMGIPVARMRKR